MPSYDFKCDTCEEEKRMLVPKDVSSPECECGGCLQRQLPRSLSTMALEMRDKYRGVHLRKDHEKAVKKRFQDHHDKYEKAEKIDKHGIDTAKRLGWTEDKK